MVLKEGDLQPGDCISCDHFMSPVTGRAIAESGYSSTRHGYTCGTIYVDHATGFMHARCQKSISAEDTIHGKLLFEQEAADSGVSIKKYHSDNGVFSSKQFKAHCKLMNQKLTFSGMGAKFQNGIAENAIKTVCNMARANMLHATMQWPGFSFLDLWPFAIAYAIWVHNHLPPSGAGWSPEELWNRTKFNSSPLLRAHVFGCPVYVLDPKLQDNKPIPKWDTKAKQGIFVGFSPDHSTSVPLIFNPRTQHISPQYHVVFDDDFTTVPTRSDELTRNQQYERLFELAKRADENGLIDGIGSTPCERFVDPSDIDAATEEPFLRDETSTKQ
jgi:hypothetical protein